MQNENKVPFDPGYYNFSAEIPHEAEHILDEIAKIKQPHKRKFEFQRFESQVIPLIKTCAAIYLGCILWGSYLHHRYKLDPKEITGNVIMEMPEEQRAKVDYDEEIASIIKFVEKLDRASKYYLGKPSRVEGLLVDCFEAYREFCSLNNNFVELDCTDKIQLPEIVSHFADYDKQKLDELKIRIDEIIASKKIEPLLEIGFYK